MSEDVLEIDVARELDRQLAVCNACRYCEGFCAVFGAAQLRMAIGDGDVAYLANLCHDCRMCYDACMFTPPHEYAINIPAVMADARVATYERFSRPALLGRMVRAPRGVALGAVAVSTAIVVLAIVLTAGPPALANAQHGPGAFYRVLPYAVMVLGGFAVAAYALACWIAGAVAYAREIGGRERFVTAASVGAAMREALALTYLRGGGGGCYDIDRRSGRRRFFHGLVFWGFIADLAATTSAAIEQDLFHRLPPYALLSVPVVLGTGGGIALAVGVAGLVAVKRRSDARPTDRRMVVLDYAFLALLELVALTGLALLAFCGTTAMGTLLAIHLGSVAALFVTAPYGKFVHFVYRSIALAKHAHERVAR